MQGTNVLSSLAPLSKPASTVMYSTFLRCLFNPSKISGSAPSPSIFINLTFLFKGSIISSRVVVSILIFVHSL